MSRRIALVGSLCLATALMSACISPASRQYGMEYDTNHSRAWNVVRFFGYAPLPEDVAAPKEFLTGGKAKTFEAAQVISSEAHPEAAKLVAPETDGVFTAKGLVEQMSKSFTKSTEENQFFGFLDDPEIQTNPQAQKRIVSILARSFFNTLRKSSPNQKFYLDLVKTSVDNDTLTTSMAVFLEDESLGCRYVRGAGNSELVGTCGIVFITKIQSDEKKSLVPFVLGGLKAKKKESRPSEVVANLLEREDREGFRYGSHAFEKDKATSGMPAFRWDGKKWCKTNEFDRILEPAFKELTKTLPPLTFVFHKKTEISDGVFAAPYLVEGNGFNFFFTPGKGDVPVGNIEDYNEP